MEPELFALGAAAAVEPNAIARGLADLWKRADEESRNTAQTALIRSCTLNLAVVVASPELIQEAGNTAATLTLRHPCRILLICAEPQSEPSGLQASVSAWCHIPGSGGHSVCCEQVTVQARGEAVRELRPLILGLLVPDIPLVVWWHGALSLDLPLFEELAGIADRIVLDSSGFDPSTAALTHLARRRERYPAALADLAWNRLTCWRELTAQFFDTPQHRPYLDRLDRVVLALGGQALRAEGLLWVGWLASRLGWTVSGAQASAAGWVCTFASRAGEVRVEIHRTADDGPIVRRLELAVGDEVRFVIEPEQAGCVRAAAYLPAHPSPPRTVPLRAGDIVQLLSDELDLAGRDRIYEEALTVAARLGEALVQ